MPVTHHPGDKIRLLLVAIVLAVATIGGIVLIDFVPPQYRIQPKWLRFGLLSCLWTAYAIKAYWKLRRSVTFWSVFLCFLIVHLFGMGYFFYVGPGLPFLVFGPACGVELIAMGFVIYWILGVGPATVRMNL